MGSKEVAMSRTLGVALLVAGVLLLVIPFLSIAASAQEKPAIKWSRDLQTASEDAAAHNRILLLRQIVCGCTEKTCAFETLGLHPWYADDEKARELIDARFIPVLVH